MLAERNWHDLERLLSREELATIEKLGYGKRTWDKQSIKNRKIILVPILLKRIKKLAGVKEKIEEHCA